MFVRLQFLPSPDYVRTAAKTRVYCLRLQNYITIPEGATGEGPDVGVADGGPDVGVADGGPLGPVAGDDVDSGLLPRSKGASSPTSSLSSSGEKPDAKGRDGAETLSLVGGVALVPKVPGSDIDIHG